MKFKVGDKVKRINKSLWPQQFGNCEEVYEVLAVDNSWTLVDKDFVQSGEKIPEDSKVLKDDTGDVVAFKRVKKPVEEFLTRYLQIDPHGWSTGPYQGCSTHVIILKVVDGEPVSAEITKLK